VRARWVLLFGGLAIAMPLLAFAAGGRMNTPKTIEAGSPFAIQTIGSGDATLFIVGTGQVLKRDVQLGQTAFFSSGSLYNAGHYLAVLEGNSFTETGSIDVVPASKPGTLSFLAKPSRLSVGLNDGITGAVYVFDTYHNLLSAPMPVSFELSSPVGTVQKRIVVTRDGAAWTAMDSTAQQGIDEFVARVGEISSTRVVEQVPGDPCGLKMNAQPSGEQVHLVTDVVRDCNGNAVPDGTIVTFTETFNGSQSTIDEPLKRGIAQATISAHNGSVLSVASGVVMGNQIRWGK
jgi:hypothetical protein